MTTLRLRLHHPTKVYCNRPAQQKVQKKATSALDVVTGKENIGPNTSSRKELGALSGLKIAADDSDIPKSRELDVASKTDEESTDEPAATVQIEHQAAEDRRDGGWGATACGASLNVDRHSLSSNPNRSQNLNQSLR
ncbi:unnamed protein product [Alternaria alternata]